MNQAARYCRDCGTVLQPSNCTPSYWTRGVKQCCECLRAYRKSRLGAERKRYRDRNIRLVKFGITVEEYEAQMRRQKGKCAICRDRPPADIDHCYETGLVRGLLCRACNLMLGMARDDTKLLRAAIGYLIDPPGVSRGSRGKIRQKMKRKTDL